MKTTAFISFLFAMFFSPSLCAQTDDYKKYLDLTYPVIDSLMYVEYGNGAYAKAIPYVQAGLEKARIDFGERDSVFAEYTANLGFFYEISGQYEKALPLMMRAKELREQLLGKEHKLVAESLSNLGLLYKGMGNYELALSYNIQAKELKEKIYGKDSDAVTLALNNLSILYYETGDYQLALPLMMQVKETRENLPNKNTRALASSFNSLGSIYRAMGKADLAISYFLQAIPIEEKLSGKEHPLYANSLSNLAVTYISVKKYAEALPLLEQAVAIQEKALGAEHPLLATSTNNLALLHGSTHNYALALELYTKAKNIYEKSSGKLHPNVAGALKNMANIQKMLGNTKAAIDLGIEAKNIYEKALGKEHPNYISIMDALGEFYLSSGDFPQAQQSYAQLLPQCLNYLTKQGTILGEKAKQDIFKTVVPCINESNAFAAFHCQHDSLFALIQDGSLLTKGYALTGLSSLLPLIQNLGDSSLAAAHTAWLYTKNQLGKAYQMSIADREKKRINIDSLQQLATQQEAVLMQASATLKERLGYDKKRFYYRDLVANIDKNEVSIDFIRFENRDTAWYYALVSQQGWAFPKYIRLCTEAQLAPFASANISLDTESYITKESDNKAVYDLIIRPLEPYLKKKKIIHFAPVALVNQIALGTLKNDKNKILASRFELHQYGSLKDFIIKKTAKGSTVSMNKKVLLVGDIAFDLDEKEHQYLAENNKPENLYVSRSVQGDTSRGASRFVRLAGTKVEIEQLNLAFANKKWQVEQLQEKEALEERVKTYTAENTPSVLHFATHGFFIAAPKQGTDNPLLRSGIALAGANRAWLGKNQVEGVEDGLWTAYEIANLDLSPAQLVVLSACETARGQIDPHEGVVGLQRSFKIAGVDNMLLSLWQVPDKETVELMQEFYKYYLEGESPAVSLRKAQDAMRKRYPSAYYWAAFVLIE